MTKQKIEFSTSHEDIARFLNQNLRVVFTMLPVNPGDSLVFKEHLGDEWSGRIFYGRAKHVVPMTAIDIENLKVEERPTPVSCVQFELFSYMDDESKDEDGNKIGRMTISADYPHDRKEFDSKLDSLSFVCDGERPVWIYDGIKWHSEVQVGRLDYSRYVGFMPTDVVLRIQSRHGERFYKYKLLMELDFLTQEDEKAALRQPVMKEDGFSTRERPD